MKCKPKKKVKILQSQYALTGKEMQREVRLRLLWYRDLTDKKITVKNEK